MIFARPKSSTFTAPVGVSLMFAGFRSRWTIPFSCAVSSASAICDAMAIASTIGSASFAQPIRQRRPFDELEHERSHAVGLFDAVNRPDVRVIERREQPRFPLEPRQPLGIAGKQRRQHLDRHVPPEPRIARPEHFAHAAGAEMPRDDVRTELLIDAKGGTAVSHERRRAQEARAAVVIE